MIISGCGFCKRIKPDYAAAATELKGEAVNIQYCICSTLVHIPNMKHLDELKVPAKMNLNIHDKYMILFILFYFSCRTKKKIQFEMQIWTIGPILKKQLKLYIRIE